MRAVAVLAVIGFHADWAWLRGGFIGVDIFFVISGYLISGLIFRALAKGTFSVREFYTRRIVRIFPALLVILAFGLIAGWVMLLPGEYRSLGKHTFGGSAFIANVLLWRETGYFDSPDKPLLHLWSLAIEEQFYLLWPAVSLIVWRRKWKLVWVLIVIIALSFAWNLWSVFEGRAAAAFYSPAARFWEILSGALLAHLESQRHRVATANREIRQAASIAGIILVVATLVGVNSGTAWPGWWALGPVIGTALIIFAGPTAWLNKNLLGNGALVWIGLISYPMYLWHWPLMVGAKIVNGGPVSLRVMLGIIAATIMLAWLTFKLVEIPIRFGANKQRSAVILFPSLIATGLLGLLVHRAVIQPRLYPVSISLEKAKQDWEFPSDGGFTLDSNTIRVDSIPGRGKRAVVFIGDSHLQQYWPRVQELSRRSLPTVLFLTHSGCMPMPNVEQSPTTPPLIRSRFGCARFHEDAMRIVHDPRIHTVVYGASWENYLIHDSMILSTDQTKQPLTMKGPLTDSAFRMFGRELQELTRSGKKVFIILSNPTIKPFDPAAMLLNRIPGFRAEPVRLAVSKQEILAATGEVTERLRKTAADAGAKVLDPLTVLCEGERCPTVWKERTPIYIDSNHLSASFVRNRAAFVDSVFY